LRQVLRRVVGAHHQHQRAVHQLANRGQGLFRVIAQVRHGQAVGDDARGIGQQGVAIRRRLGGDAGADRPACPAAVLDDDALAQHLLHVRRHQPGRRIGATAWRPSDDQADRPFRPMALRPAGASDGEGGKGQAGGQQATTPHPAFLRCCWRHAALPDGGMEIRPGPPHLAGVAAAAELRPRRPVLFR
jgi:hypothetical protein